MSLKIIEPVQTCLKVFDNVGDFEKYYMKHRDTMDSDTTHKLNKKYRIEGYRITRIKGELQLKRLRDVVEHVGVSGFVARLEKLEEIVNELVARYNESLV